ncbi:hypothetical protein [Streptomyces sp. NBC_01423]|uniref:hypothetical protein n=1 Tax=Streptomyces sp. NBC_01423 TaxID=2903860 RepID=UPI003FCD0EB3
MSTRCRARRSVGWGAAFDQFVITGGGQRLVAFGDSLHSPVQVDRPEWSCVYDHDPVGSAEHRRRLVAELAEPGTLAFGIHFADAVFGRVVRDGAGPVWRPLESADGLA